MCTLPKQPRQSRRLARKAPPAPHVYKKVGNDPEKKYIEHSTNKDLVYIIQVSKVRLHEEVEYIVDIVEYQNGQDSIILTEKYSDKPSDQELKSEFVDWIDDYVIDKNYAEGFDDEGFDDEESDEESDDEDNDDKEIKYTYEDDKYIINDMWIRRTNYTHYNIDY